MFGQSAKLVTDLILEDKWICLASLMDIFLILNIFQGEALFQTHENLEHLAMMERVLGPLPEHMIQKAR